MGGDPMTTWTAQHFFERIVPRRIADDPKKYAQMRGTIGFHIEGSGSWTLQLGNLSRPVGPGRPRRTDLDLSFTSRAFDALIAGTLDPERELEDGELDIAGDVKLLRELASLVSVPTGMLGFLGRDI